MKHNIEQIKDKTDGEEWGYCPMCDNDQVELKRKSVIDKLMEHSEEIVIRTEKDSKYGTVIVRTATPVIRLNKAMELFKELEQKLEITEKALELACETVKYFEEMQDKEMGFNEFFGYDSVYDLQAIIEQYKEQAKEMGKDE